MFAVPEHLGTQRAQATKVRHGTPSMNYTTSADHTPRNELPGALERDAASRDLVLRMCCSGHKAEDDPA